MFLHNLPLHSFRSLVLKPNLGNFLADHHLERCVCCPVYAALCMLPCSSKSGFLQVSLTIKTASASNFTKVWHCLSYWILCIHALIDYLTASAQPRPIIFSSVLFTFKHSTHRSYLQILNRSTFHRRRRPRYGKVCYSLFESGKTNPSYPLKKWYLSCLLYLCSCFILSSLLSSYEGTAETKKDKKNLIFFLRYLCSGF